MRSIPESDYDITDGESAVSFGSGSVPPVIGSVSRTIISAGDSGPPEIGSESTHQNVYFGDFPDSVRLSVESLALTVPVPPPPPPCPGRNSYRDSS